MTTDEQLARTYLTFNQRFKKAVETHSHLESMQIWVNWYHYLVKKEKRRLRQARKKRRGWA